MGNKHGHTGAAPGKKTGKHKGSGKDTVSGVRHELTEPISNYYEITSTTLGKGNFSEVKLGIEKATGREVAIKIVKKETASHKPEMLKNEVDILLTLDHPHIIKLLDLFDTPDTLYLVMELVTGGELFDRIVAREQYSEQDAREVMRQVFDAIRYIHSKGIVHRDLKPENLLLESESDDTSIRLTDFGLSRIYTSEMMSTACGTPGYVAPEILESKGYTSAVDMWSAGVIMYILLCGYPPFYSDNDAELFESIMQAKYTFHSPYWDHISEEAKNLIKCLLVPNPEKRLTADQAVASPWFTSDKTKAATASVIHQDMRSKLKVHNDQRKSQVNFVQSTNLTC